METTSTATSTDTTVAANAAATRVRNPKSQLKVEDFINMMVTQLQNQDPTDPAKSDQLLSQMSQIGQLQSQQELQTSLATMVQQNSLGSAGNLIGKVIKGTDSAGGEVTGAVSSVKVIKGDVTLELDSGKQLSLSKVTDIVGEESNVTTGPLAPTGVTPASAANSTSRAMSQLVDAVNQRRATVGPTLVPSRIIGTPVAGG